MPVPEITSAAGAGKALYTFAGASLDAEIGTTSLGKSVANVFPLGREIPRVWLERSNVLLAPDSLGGKYLNGKNSE